jgi:hypothetical protein
MPCSRFLFTLVRKSHAGQTQISISTQPANSSGYKTQAEAEAAILKTAKEWIDRKTSA